MSHSMLYFLSIPDSRRALSSPENGAKWLLFDWFRAIHARRCRVRNKLRILANTEAQKLVKNKGLERLLLPTIVNALKG